MSLDLLTHDGSSPVRAADHIALLMERSWTSAECDLFMQVLVKRIRQTQNRVPQLDDPDDIAMRSRISGGLLGGHPLRDQHVFCDKCSELVHAANNECMQTWFEFRGSILCSACLKEIPFLYAIEGEDFIRFAQGG